MAGGGGQQMMGGGGRMYRGGGPMGAGMEPGASGWMQGGGNAGMGVPAMRAPMQGGAMGINNPMMVTRKQMGNSPEYQALQQEHQQLMNAGFGPSGVSSGMTPPQFSGTPEQMQRIQQLQNQMSGMMNQFGQMPRPQPGPMQGMQPGLTGGMMGGQQPMYNDLMQPFGTTMNNMTMPQAGQAPTPTPDVQQLMADRAAMRANPNAQRAAQMRGAELMRNRRF